jgi:hypothetical protein
MRHRQRNGNYGAGAESVVGYVIVQVVLSAHLRNDGGIMPRYL